MDHLATDEERKERWYCHSVWPRFVPVTTPQTYDDFLAPIGSPPESVHAMPYEFLLGDKNSSSSAMRHFFQTNGFLVVSGVLSPQDCDTSLALATAWVQAARFADAQLANNDITPQRRIRSVEGGIIPFYGSGHSAFAWSIRSHPNVRKVFESLLGTADVLASLDGVILWDNHAPSDLGWFHLDQNPCVKPEVSSIQGLVNLVNVTEETGGNVLVLGSHELFPEHYTDGHDPFYTQRLKELNGDDWLEVDPNDNAVLVADKVVSLGLKAGDVLVWDSRMVHCSYPPKNGSGDATKQGERFLRAATLVSMMPREKVPQKTIEHRRQAVDAMLTLTHWVDKVSVLGEERTEAMERDRSVIELMKAAGSDPEVLLGWEDLTQEQRNLVCGDALYLTQSLDLNRRF